MRETIPLLIFTRGLAVRVVGVKPTLGCQSLLYVQSVIERARGLHAGQLREAGTHHAAALEAANSLPC